MILAARALAIAASATLLIPMCAFRPDAAPAHPRIPAGRVIAADIVVTAAPAYEPLAALRGGERFPKGAQLLLVHQGKAEPLVAGFVASADANVSFDGKRVLFAGKQKAGDPWQIWELTLDNRSLHSVISGDGDAIRPFYLPFGRLVYARHTAKGFHLEAAGKDDSDALAPIDASASATLLQLSYLPASAIPTDVQQDGRILFEAGFPLGTGSTPELLLVYSDGSGVESYRCDHGRARWGGKQLASGDVVFTHGASLARFTSPLASEAHIAAPPAEYAGAIAETASGDWLMSARAAAGAHYALKLWKPGATTLQTVWLQNGEDLVEPVIVAPHTRPKRHPSGLHDWSYANMMALDARLSREALKMTPASVRLETLDASGHAAIVGAAPVEADGSFFVKTPADQPIRFALLDAKGSVVRQEHGWFWIRRGEQRVCVGCHTGPERSSQNRLPAVLQRTTTPTDLFGANWADKPHHGSPEGH
jgi:hypothetical protein